MAAPSTTAAVRRRYARIASIYDRANLEGFLYADARERAVELLQLRPGATVLDVACGTGANFPLIQQRIGAAGAIVGVDLTPEMLARARARMTRNGWANVQLRETDITGTAGSVPGAPFDAAICTLGLSVIPRWRDAWEAMSGAVRPGGRLAIMDAGIPDSSALTAAGRALEWPLSRLFAADCNRRPWQLLERDTAERRLDRFTWGWVTAAAGTVIES